MAASNARTLDKKAFRLFLSVENVEDIMDVVGVIGALNEAEGPNRKIDSFIAKLMGWRKTIKSQQETDGTIGGVAVWFAPDGTESKKIPFYTESVQTAYELVKELAPDVPGACVFDETGGRAHLDGMEPVFAKSVPLALCIAGLRLGLDRGLITMEELE